MKRKNSDAMRLFERSVLIARKSKVAVVMKLKKAKGNQEWL